MQAARDLEMRRPTVWSMMHRVRAAMKDDGKLLAGIVEMDETFIGGKPRKKNRRDDDPRGGDKSKRGRGTDKEAVIGVIERGGKVRALPVEKSEMTMDYISALVRRLVDALLDASREMSDVMRCDIIEGVTLEKKIKGFLK